MSFRIRRMPGSIFKKFFVMISVTVLFSLAGSGIFLLFMYADSWNRERMLSLSNDAVGLSKSVEFLFEDKEHIPMLERLKNEDVLVGLASALSSVSLTNDEEVFLVDNRGGILLCKDVIVYNEKELYIKDSCPLHISKEFSVETVAQFETSDPVYTYDGKIDSFGSGDYFLAAAKINADTENDYYIVIIQEKGSAYLPYTTSFMQMIFRAEILALFICFVAAMVISYRLSKPLKKLTDATKHYASGDFSVRIGNTDTYRELEELVESVNSMADSLAVLEESRSNFVANISHELKTPMTIIGGFIDGILDGTISEDERDKYLATVSDEVKRLSRLVVAMLNMSKIQAGKLTLNYSEIDLNDIILKIFLSFENELAAKEIDVAGLDTCEKITIKADDALINQIFYNLIDNAVKFTYEKGVISVAMKTEKNTAVIKIKNTGKGIPEEDIGLIFDRFYKGDKSRGLDSKSFGLGLYIVKSVVELHKGSINVNSKVDEYTEFVIKLPRQV